MADATSGIERLMRPRSVAVIGASTDISKTAGRPVGYLLKHGFDGAIWPVNPRAKEIAGLACYPDIASLPHAPDVGIIMLSVDRAHVAVRELSARGTPAAIAIASGYAETGAEGARRQDELRRAAGAMRLLGPNTIGLVNLTEKIILSASGALEMDHFPAGNIGFVSQSGGILGSLLSRAAARGAGMSKLISTSNEADLDLADFVDYLADDEATKVIALYIEGLRDADKFRAAVAKAARAGKPVVAYKVGRSEAGARAAISHTGALAGADEIYDAFFRAAGIIRARTFDDLLGLPLALSAGRRPGGKRVAILTSTGGAGTLVADSLGELGFDAPAPGEATTRELRALEKGDTFVLDRNPIDVTLAGLQPALLRGAISALLASDDYDALVIIVGSSGIAQPELMAEAIRDCIKDSKKPVLAYISPHAPQAASVLAGYGVPAYPAPESCAAALAALWQAAQQRSEPSRLQAGAVVLPDYPAGPLDEAQAKELFSHFGIACAHEIIVTNASEAEAAARELGDSVALKVLSRDIAHKSDVGGVTIGATAQDIAARLAAMADNVERRTGQRPQRFLVQEMVRDGVEIILGVKRDALGMALLIGMGGVTAELLQDKALRLLPPGGELSREDAHSMLRELKTYPLLDGYRGRRPMDVDSLALAITAFSRMATQLADRLIEAEINPLFVLPRGQGVRAADGLAVFAPRL